MLFLVVHEASEYGAVGDLDCCLNKTISVHFVFCVYRQNNL